MENLSPALREDYLQQRKLIPNNEVFEENEMDYDAVLKAHYLICDYFESNYNTTSLFGVRDFNLLGSAIARQTTEFNGYRKWKTPYEKMATLFFGLVKNHPFHDGNKRTALLTLLFHLYRNNRVPRVDESIFEDFTVHVAESNYSQYQGYHKYSLSYSGADAAVYYIAEFIEKRTRKQECKYKPLTYHEFNTKLKNFDCYMADPIGNYINVYKMKKIFGIFPPKPQKLLQIGFPGWKKQINNKAQKEVLKVLELTKEHGIDSQVFFEGAEPLYELIQKYENPLARLKDK